MNIRALSSLHAQFVAISALQDSRAKAPPPSQPAGSVPKKDLGEPTPMAAAGDLPLAEPQPVLPGFHAMEAYFSWDGKQIIFQGAEKPSREIPLQVFTWPFADSGENPLPPKALTSSSHDCECTYFSADSKYVVFNTQPKDAPSQSLDFGGYPYAYDTGKETFLGRFTGNEITLEQLTHNDAYEAETSFSPPFHGHPGYPQDGTYLLFTSSRSGSLDLYVRRILDAQGTRVAGDETVQITHTPTIQEGGAFFMPDGRIVYRAWEFDPKDPQKERWERNRVNYRPMQLYLYDPVKKETQQLTSGNARHWAPFPHRKGDRIVFAKRDFSEGEGNFDIFVFHLENGRQERITQHPLFDGYPVFNPRGDVILFSRYLTNEHRFQLMQVPYRD